MYIIYKSGCHVSAIFKDEDVARKYWKKCPKGQMFLSFKYVREYPFYILETHKGSFRCFANKKDIEDEKLKIPYVVYEVQNDFAPKTKGIDKMGMLPHTHYE